MSSEQPMMMMPNVDSSAYEPAPEDEVQLPSLEAVRKATGLGDISPSEVMRPEEVQPRRYSSIQRGALSAQAFETFKYFAPNGVVPRPTFHQCIQRFMPSMSEVGEHGHRYFTKVVDRVFDLFDTDGASYTDARARSKVGMFRLRRVARYR